MFRRSCLPPSPPGARADRTRAAQVFRMRCYARKVHTIPHEGLGVSHLIAAQALEAQGKAQEAAVEYSTFLQEAPNDPMAPRVRSALAQIGQNASGSAPRR